MKTETKKSDALAENNLGLVHLCANRFRGKGIEYDDLYGAGCIGLMKAARAFDTERGVRFSTYAVPVILGEIKRLFRDGGTVKVSRSLKELSLRLTRERERFLISEGREPTVSELSLISGESEELVAEALGASLPPVSLTSDLDDSEGSETDIPVASPDGEINDRLSLYSTLASLEARDRRLIYLRYFKEKTQTEVASELGMTQVQVSRREKKLLALMREALC
ncbi:MAG: sigma-70 family RNA polymerase sigma factor [Ruminococcus sp.]|nr:sigma-70 family RNA polymerase sigma factor [Ruminococcus sp.]